MHAISLAVVHLVAFVRRVLLVLADVGDLAIEHAIRDEDLLGVEVFVVHRAHDTVTVQGQGGDTVSGELTSTRTSGSKPANTSPFGVLGCCPLRYCPLRYCPLRYCPGVLSPSVPVDADPILLQQVLSRGAVTLNPKP